MTILNQNLPDHYLQVPGGVGELNGQLLQGDQIIKVNQTNLSNSTQAQATISFQASTPTKIVRITIVCFILASSPIMPYMQAFNVDKFYLAPLDASLKHLSCQYQPYEYPLANVEHLSISQPESIPVL